MLTGIRGVGPEEEKEGYGLWWEGFEGKGFKHGMKD